MKIGDIVILTEDSSIYKACMSLPRIKPLSDFKLKKGQRFEVSKLVRNLFNDSQSYVYEIKLIEDKDIFFEPNMYYFITEKEYLKINREEKLDNLGIWE